MTKKINKELIRSLSKEIRDVINNFIEKSAEKSSDYEIYVVIGNALYRNASSFSLQYARLHWEYISEGKEPSQEDVLKICKEICEDFFTLDEDDIINHILKNRITVGMGTENEGL